MRLALEITLVGGSLFAGGALGFLAITALLMRAHVPKRTARETLAYFGRELLWILLTQPLLPLYFFVGRRMSRGSGVPVVVVHGYGQNRVDFIRFARVFARSGGGPVFGFNYLFLRGLGPLAGSLERFIDGVRRETQSDRVDLVCHSMGGLVAAKLLAEPGAHALVRRCVTVATPHHGLAYKGPIFGAARRELRLGHGVSPTSAVPLLSVYSAHDNVVFPATKSSHIEEPHVENLEVAHLGHLGILFERRVLEAITRWLLERD
ncbi:MAG: hypothetical protein U0271_22270 [Polyangiaceae bacterium]